MSKSINIIKANSWKILVVLNLVLLAVFLTFWLNKAYQEEIESLKNEIHYQMAQEVMAFVGIDFQSLLNEVGNKNSLDKLNFNVQLGDNDKVIQVYDSTKTEQLQIVQLDIPEGQVPQIFADTIHTKRTYTIFDEKKVKMLPFPKSGSTSYVSNSFFFTDSIRGEYASDAEMEAKMQAQIETAEAKIPMQALYRIFPQILFAILLFGLSVLVIYLIQRNFRQQQLVLESRNNFISNITHELKTPVSTISVALEAIQNFNVQADTKRTQDYIQASRNELNRLSFLIDQVLRFSQIDAGTEIYDQQPHSLKKIVEEALQSMEIPIQQKEAQVALQVTGNWFVGQFDAFHIKNMIHNLLDNSLKYGSTGVEIDINLVEQNGHINLQVKDNGPGIPQQYQRKVFDRFFRVPQGDTHNVKGYGLGLSYVAEVVKAHRGQIELQSKEGSGTEVILKFNKINEAN